MHLPQKISIPIKHDRLYNKTAIKSICCICLRQLQKCVLLAPNKLILMVTAEYHIFYGKLLHILDMETPPPPFKKKKKVFANNRFEYVVFSMLVWLLITQILHSFFLFFSVGGGGGVVPTNKYKPASLIINLMIKSITKYSCHKTT